MQALVHEIEATEIIIVLVAVAIVTFLPTLVRWLIALASTAIIATLSIGLFAIWQSMHH